MRCCNGGCAKTTKAKLHDAHAHVPFDAAEYVDDAELRGNELVQAFNIKFVGSTCAKRSVSCQLGCGHETTAERHGKHVTSVQTRSSRAAHDSVVSQARLSSSDRELLNVKGSQAGQTTMPR